MQLFSGFENYNWNKVTITTGMFDGVHRGHQELIKFVTDKAHYYNEKSVLVTFKPHPRYVINPNDPFKLLSTYNERVELMARTGLDGMVVIPFTKEVSNTSSEKFILDLLVKKAGISHYVFGYDHKFGKNREGSVEKVKALGKQHNFEVLPFDAVHKDSSPVSSSRIREALSVGDMPCANDLLGYTYGITGQVVKGVQIGRTLGFPTANIKLEDMHKMIPAMGVYAVRVEVEGARYKGMLNIGIRPTVNSSAEFPTIEVHLINFAGDLYGKEIHVKFIRKIREEMKFDGLQGLREQLKQDKASVLNVL